MVQMMTQSYIFTTNQTRLKLFGIFREDDPFLKLGYQDEWDELPMGFLLLASDLYDVLLCYISIGCFFSVCSVRVNLSWVVPVQFSAVFLFLRQWTIPKGFYFEAMLWATVSSGAFAFWFGSFLREKTARRLWRTECQHATLISTQENLLQVMTSAVVRVVGDEIKSTYDFASVFGEDVHCLGDMPTTKDDENEAFDLRAFVEKVKVGGFPMKRSFEFLNRATGYQIDCLVCATVTVSETILVGFIVNDTKEIRPHESYADRMSSVSHCGGSEMSRVKFEDVSGSGVSRERTIQLQKFNLHPGRLRYESALTENQEGATVTWREATYCAISVHVKFRYINVGHTEISTKKTHEDRELNNTMKEMKFLLQFRHPAILCLIGYVMVDDWPTLVFERFSMMLDAYMEEKAISSPVAIRITAQISCAVTYLHDRGYCHHAVLAENVALMQCTESALVAKLTNFSQCFRTFGARDESVRVASPQHKKDVTDLASLLGGLLMHGVMQGEDQGSALDNDKIMARLASSFPECSMVISTARAGNLTSHDFSLWITELETTNCYCCRFSF
jgi:hypothetical protein